MFVSSMHNYLFVVKVINQVLFCLITSIIKNHLSNLAFDSLSDINQSKVIFSENSKSSKNRSPFFSDNLSVIQKSFFIILSIALKVLHEMINSSLLISSFKLFTSRFGIENTIISEYFHFQ